MIYKKNIRDGAALITISVMVALAGNAVLPGRIPHSGLWGKEKGAVAANIGNGIVDDIEIGDVGTAKLIFDSGQALFVDARPSGIYSDAHVQGAVSLPMGQFDSHIESFMSRYPETTYIVSYCSGRTCMDGHELAKLLSEYGYENINIFIDGFSGWEKNGFPIEGLGPA